MRIIHRPIRPVHRIHPTEFLTVRLHPVKNKHVILILRVTRATFN